MPLALIAAILSALGTLLLEPASARRLAATGLLVLAFGWISLMIGAGGFVGHPPLTLDDSPFTRISAGLVLLGLVGAAAALALGVRAGAWLAAVLVAAGIASAGSVALPLLGTAGAGALLPAVAVGVVIALLAGLGAWLRRRKPPVAGLDPRAVPARAWMVLGLGVALTAGAPHLYPIVAGALAGAVAGEWLLRARRGRRRIPWVVLFSLPLVAFGWFLTVVAGPTGLTVRALAEAPLSPAAETLLVLLLAIAALPLAGLWPFHRLAPPELAPVGGALLIRLGAQPLLGGMLHWQPALFLLAAAGVWWGVIAGRRALLLASLGALGAASGNPTGWIGAALLFPSAPAAAWQWPESAARWRRLAWLVPAAGGVLVVAGGLLAEVVLTLVAVVALVVACWRYGAER